MAIKPRRKPFELVLDEEGMEWARHEVQKMGGMDKVRDMVKQIAKAQEKAERRSE